MDRFTVTCLLAVASVCACGNPTYISHDYDPEADFDRYRTFGWIDQKTMESRKQSMRMNPLVESRIKRAVNRGLSARGLIADTENPDLLLVYHVGVQNITEVRRTGYGWWYGGDNVRADQFQEGTFMLDMIDARTRRMVWRGIAEGVLDDNPSPDKLDKDVYDMVERLLRKYPPPK